MKQSTQKINVMFLMALGFVLVSCDDGGGKGGNTDTGGGVTPVIADGKTFYLSECAACHSNGADDTVSAFDASNLAVASKYNKIKSDMSAFGGKPVPSVDDMMGRFSNLSAQRVADLKAYLKSIK